MKFNATDLLHIIIEYRINSSVALENIKKLKFGGDWAML